MVQVCYIKGYGKNLLFEMQHSSTCFFVNHTLSPLGKLPAPPCSQLSGLDGIKLNPAFEWDFININRTECPTPVSDCMHGSDYAGGLSWCNLREPQDKQGSDSAIKRHSRRIFEQISGYPVAQSS